MLTKNHARLVIEVQKHIAADAVIQGIYWDAARATDVADAARVADAAARIRQRDTILKLIAEA